MRAAAVRVELHIPESQSLKDKRRVLRGLIDGLRSKVSVSVAEVGHHDVWQRAAIGIAIVAPGAGRLEHLIDTVHDYVDSEQRAQIIEFVTSYLEEPA